MHCLIPFRPWSSLHTDSNDFHFLCCSHWSTMQTLHRPDATVLPCLTGQWSVSASVLTWLQSSLIHHFNPIFLFPDSGAQGSQTGKVINLLVHSTDARFLSLSPLPVPPLEGVWCFNRVSTMATDRYLMSTQMQINMKMPFTCQLLGMEYWITKSRKNLSFCTSAGTRTWGQQPHTTFKVLLVYVSS